MSERTPPMLCPKCRAQMNHHADKLVEPTDARQAARVDPSFGGVIQQTHGCPDCGFVEFRLEDERPIAD